MAESIESNGIANVIALVFWSADFHVYTSPPHPHTLWERQVVLLSWLFLFFYSKKQRKKQREVHSMLKYLDLITFPFSLTGFVIDLFSF